MPEQPAVYRFGQYELRMRTRELYKQGTKLKMRPQPFQVLKLLVERAGDAVTRDELRHCLWPAETFVDFEHGLNTSIKELRGILSDSAVRSRYVETVPKLGYRLIVPVYADDRGPSTESITPPTPIVLEQATEEKIFPSRLPQSTSYLRPAVAAGLTLVVLLALAAYFSWLRTRPRSQPLGGRALVAVLPFENLTGDASQDYFSDGLTEEMIAQLGRLDPTHLGVIARTSVMHYKHTQEPLDQIARALGVQYVLEGSVRRDAGKVRITAQLIQTKDQTHLLSRQYDRELANLLTVQAEIAREIAGEIQITLGDSKHSDFANQPSLSPTAYEAYDLYLKGRYFWNKRTQQGFQRAVDCFQLAIEKDPSYAPAYAGLADSYALTSIYGQGDSTELMRKARVAALHAIELDDTLAEAHASLAVIAQNYDWNWQVVDKEYRRAIELDSNYATAHHWYAESLALQGRFDEAFLEIERARQLDPLSLIIAADRGAILYFSRQYDRAIEQLRAVLDMEPNFPRAQILVLAYAQKAMYPEALADVEKWRKIDDGPLSWMMLAYVYGRSGQQDKARLALRKLEEFHRNTKTISFPIAVAHIGMGDKEKAIAWLQKAYADHGISTALKVDPIYDALRDDPRFQQLLQGIGLTPALSSTGLKSASLSRTQVRRLR
jgi:TolB-like protein/DNA-binding winged helix-turn-helix (wHTH) protein/Tfp pilus assembly protein PilF